MVKNPKKVESKKRIMARQAVNDPSCHHPTEKKEQAIKALELLPGRKLKTLELFSGHGNMTKIYEQYGTVECFDKIMGTGDSYIRFHGLISEKKHYDIIDIDPYGLPCRLFPDIFLLCKPACVLFVTHCKPNVPILSGARKKLFKSYYGIEVPTAQDIESSIKRFALCHWYEIETLSMIEMKTVWRWCFIAKRVKAFTISP
jgi:hypothetical protein